MELEDSFNSSDLDSNVLHIEQIKLVTWYLPKTSKDLEGLKNAITS